MRIFFACDRSPNASFESNLWWQNLYYPLLDLGHEVIPFDYDLRETFQHLDTTQPQHQRFVIENRPKVSQALLTQIQQAHREKPIDLFFSYFYDACVLPETLQAIRQMGIKTVNWYCNGSYQLHLVQNIAPHYDWCLVPEKFRLEDYRQLGANPIYCQEAANPNFYRPSEERYHYEVSFVGQAYGDRPAYLSYLHQQGLPLRVWGKGWQRYNLSLQPPLKQLRHNFKTLFQSKSFASHLKRPPLLPGHLIGDVLPDREMVNVFSQSKINLGFSTCGNTHQSGEKILQVRLRDFEVPMSGGFYMVEYMEELEAFFNIGTEIVCYRDAEDLAQKIRYYLSHDEEREAIRSAGYQRCLQDHSWQQRLAQAFQEMGLMSPLEQPIL